MIMSELIEKYRKYINLETIELLRIIQRAEDYTPDAIETVKIEINIDILVR
jgi:hypothetical protein